MAQYVDEIRTGFVPRGPNQPRVDAVQPNKLRTVSTTDQPAPECLVLGLHGSAAVLDVLRFGVILMDSAAELMHANAAAQRILARAEPLRLAASRRVQVNHHALNHELVKYLAAARRWAHDHESDGIWPDLLALRVARPEWIGWYRLIVTPLPAPAMNQRLNGSAPLQVMFVHEPRAQPAAEPRVLKQLYGLTQAEARVASQLFEGYSIPEVARALCLSANTIRTHVKHIFDKCEVSSQAELAKQIALCAHHPPIG